MKNKTWNPLNEVELLQPLSRKKATMYVLNDLFADEIEFSQINKVMAVIALCSQHTFQLATKDAKRMKVYFDSKTTYCEIPAYVGYFRDTLGYSQKQDYDFPLQNLWLGVQIENQEQADSQIPLLLKIPAAVRFVLCEPLLSRVDFLLKNEFKLSGGEHYEKQWHTLNGTYVEILNNKWSAQVQKEKIDWVIVGGANGKNAQPMHPNLVRSVKDQCKAANVPFFFKGWGEWLPVEKRGEYWYVNSGATTYTRAYLAENHIFDENNYAAKVGKKLSGYLLDGIEYKELPK